MFKGPRSHEREEEPCPELARACGLEGTVVPRTQRVCGLTLLPALEYLFALESRGLIYIYILIVTRSTCGSVVEPTFLVGWTQCVSVA